MPTNYADYFVSTYSKTHQDRLKENFQFARETLLRKYDATVQAAKYYSEISKSLQEEYTKSVEALLEYDEKRGGSRGSIDEITKLLGIMTDNARTFASETGESKQRQLEAGAAVEQRYQLSNGQSTAVGNASDFIEASDKTAIKSDADVKRHIDETLSKIPDGTFAPGADASKVGMSELYSRLDENLQASDVYKNNSELRQVLIDKIAAKTGVDPAYYNKAEVKLDKDKATKLEQNLVGQTGLGLATEATSLARNVLMGKLGTKLTPQQVSDVENFQEKYGAKYFDYLEDGLNIEQAQEKITEKMSPEEKMLFEDSFHKTRTALAEGGAQDLQKLFDPAYVDLFSSSREIKEELGDARSKFKDYIEQTLAPPTEHEARRLGSEQYQYVSPGVGKRTKLAGVELEKTAQMSRATGTPMSDDDFMASRIMKKAPQLSDQDKILRAASSSALKELDKGWKPTAKVVRENVEGGNMTADEFEAIDNAPFELGLRLYNNVRERQLKDITPAGILKHASALAGGQLNVRDGILQEYYKHAGYEMRGKKALQQSEEVEAVEQSTEE